MERSLQAAVADPACARDLLAGRLSGPLQTDGLAAFGPPGAIAPRTESVRAADDVPDPANRALRNAQDALQHARDAAAEADLTAAEARDAYDVAEQALSGATANLTALRKQLKAAERDHMKTERSVASATATLKETEAASERARAAEVAASNQVRALRTKKPTPARPR